MKKIFVFLLAALCMFSFSACNIYDKGDVSASTGHGDLSSDNQIDSPYTDNDAHTLSDTLPTYEQVQAEYPDKTVIVWMVQYVRSVRVKEINRYLDDNGYNFAVCFKAISPYESDSKMFPDTYASHIKTMVNDGEQIDIISPLNYKDYVFDGLYTPLDEYFETETGKKLYDIMPPEHWESLRINGSIYGVHGPDGYTLSPDWGYYVNAELAEKYNFDVSRSINEQLDILKDIKKNESGCDVFAMSKSRMEIPVLNVGIKEISGSVATVYWNGESHSAECLFDNTEYLEKLRLYDSLTNVECFRDVRSSSSDSFFIMQDNVEGASTVYETSNKVKIKYNENVIDAIPVFNEPTYIRECGVATGICNASQHKDRAFELLALTQTDPQLNNLLAFGVEGEDYTLTDDDIIDTIISLNPFNTVLFANNMICLQYEDNAFTAEQYRIIYENAKSYEDSEFVINIEKIADELEAVEPIMNDFKLREEIDDTKLTFEETISLTRERLENAGIQKIIDECNRQYGEYKNEKN